MLPQAEVFINMQNLHIDFPDFGQHGTSAVGFLLPDVLPTAGRR
jgi:hypothetical protein